MGTFQTLVDQALKLSEKDRSYLAYRILQSLGPPGADVTEEESQNAWAIEIAARSTAVHDGTAALLDARESIERIRQSLIEKANPV